MKARSILLKSLAPLLMALCFCSISWASEPQSLTLTVHLVVSDHRESSVQGGIEMGDGSIRHVFFVVLKNMSSAPLIVIKGTTDQLVHETTFDENDHLRHRLIYRCELGSLGNGDPDIPSEADLKLVKLFQGEATQFRVILYSDRKIEKERIQFVYSVGQKLAARFGTWSGKIEATPTQ